MSFMPRYRENPPNILYAGSDQEGCGIDPETGQSTCTGRVERSPEPHEPEPDNPFPKDEPEPEPAPPPQMDKAFLLALFNMFTDAITSALTKPLTNLNYEPLQLPARPRPLVPVVEPLSPRAIPASEPLLSTRLSPVVQNTLRTLHNQYQERLRERLQANQQAAQGGGEIARGIVEASNASFTPNNQQTIEQTAIVYELPQTPQNPATAQAFQDLFNPRTNQPNWLIQEDPGWIQANLAHAARPVSPHEQFQAAQEAALRRQQMETQQAYYQAQIELAQAQRQTLQKRQWTEQEKFNQASFNNKKSKNALKRLLEGQYLEDLEVKQLLHSTDLQRHGAKTEAEKLQAEIRQAYIKQKLAENMVANSIQDVNGNVLIGNAVVRSEDALYFAKQDIQHFHDTDTHLTPSQLRAINPEELRRINERSNQIINESKNKDDKKAVDYFKNTANRPTGSNSLNQPLYTQDAGAMHYFAHGLLSNENTYWKSKNKP